MEEEFEKWIETAWVRDPDMGIYTIRDLQAAFLAGAAAQRVKDAAITRNYGMHQGIPISPIRWMYVVAIAALIERGGE